MSDSIQLAKYSVGHFIDLTTKYSVLESKVISWFIFNQNAVS